MWGFRLTFVFGVKSLVIKIHLNVLDGNTHRFEAACGQPHCLKVTIFFGVVLEDGSCAWVFIFDGCCVGD